MATEIYGLVIESVSSIWLAVLRWKCNISHTLNFYNDRKKVIRGFHYNLHSWQWLFSQSRRRAINKGTVQLLCIYSKTCLKRPLKTKTKNSFQDRLSLNAGQKYCRMLLESILQYFRPSLIYHLSLRPSSLFCLF